MNSVAEDKINEQFGRLYHGEASAVEAIKLQVKENLIVRVEHLRFQESCIEVKRRSIATTELGVFEANEDQPDLSSDHKCMNASRAWTG